MPTERERELSRIRNRRYSENLSPEKKKAKRVRDRENRLKKKKARSAENEKLLKEGKRVCSLCHNKKSVTEFSYNKRTLAKQLNKICDACLIQRYQEDHYSPAAFSPAFWRKKAYCCNCTAKSRSKRTGESTGIQDLVYKVSGEDVIKIYTDQKGMCVHCGVEITETNIHIDHKTPLSRGGQHIPENLSIVCEDCNRLKHTKNVTEFDEFLYTYAERVLKSVRSRG